VGEGGRRKVARGEKWLDRSGGGGQSGVRGGGEKDAGGKGEGRKNEEGGGYKGVKWVERRGVES